MPPLITIGLPCYNAAGTLVPTLQSIFAQTYADGELLALDDGSTDGTLALLQQITDPRVRILADGVNKGRGVEKTALTTSIYGAYCR